MSETQNVTLSLPKELLRQAKIIAIEENTSLSQLLKTAIVEIVTKADRYKIAQAQHLDWLKEAADLGNGGKPQWTREDLHER